MRRISSKVRWPTLWPSRLGSMAAVCSASTRVTRPPILTSGRKLAARAAVDVGATNHVDSGNWSDCRTRSPLAHSWTADRLIPYNGGQGASVVNGPSVADVNAFWRKADQCGPPALTAAGPVTTSTAACAHNRSVVLITIDGGGHQWPGGTTFLERGDPMSHALNATQTLWQFFAAHPAS